MDTDYNLSNAEPAILNCWLLIHSREGCDSHVTHQYTPFIHTHTPAHSQNEIKKKSQEGVSGEEYYKGYKSLS